MWKEMTRMHPNQKLDTLISQIILNKIQQFAAFLYIQAVQKATKHSTPADTAPQFLIETDPLYSVLLTVCQTILKMLFQCIWYWINKQSLPEIIIFFTIVTWPVCDEIVTRSYLLVSPGNLRFKFLQPFYFYPKVINK